MSVLFGPVVQQGYIVPDESPGVMIQLMARNDTIDELFRIIEDASKEWDGKTEPVRQIDWSTGRPVARGN